MKDTVTLEVEVDGEGNICGVTENGEPLNYEPEEKNRMDDGCCIINIDFKCCWKKVRGFWRCGPC